MASRGEKKEEEGYKHSLGTERSRGEGGRGEEEEEEEKVGGSLYDTDRKNTNIQGEQKGKILQRVVSG